MTSLEKSPSNFIDPGDDMTTSMTQSERMKWMEGKWDEEMDRRFPRPMETKAAKSAGRSVLDVAFRGTKAPSSPETKKPGKPEKASEAEPENPYGEFRAKKFETRRAGESEADFEKRKRDRERRKLIAAMTYTPDAMFEEDFETAEPGATSSMKNTVKMIAEADDEEFYADTRFAVSKIETPMDREGAEGIFKKISDDRALLEVVYYATRNDGAWTEMPEAKEPDLDIVGQEKLGRAALEAFYKKYGNAADLRKLEKELASDPRFHGVHEKSSVDPGKEYDGKDKFDIFEDALDRLSETLYGAQEEYVRAAEDFREDAKKVRARLNTPKPAERPVSKPVAKPKEAPKKTLEAPIWSEKGTSVLRPETFSAPTAYSPRVADRRVRSGGYTSLGYGYTGGPRFESNIIGGPAKFSEAHTPKFSGPAMEKPFERKFSGPKVEPKPLEAPEKAPETEENPEEKFPKLSKEEFTRFRDLFAKRLKLGDTWHALINGVRRGFNATAQLYVANDLGADVKTTGTLGGKEREILLSKPFDLGGDRTALIAYYYDTEKVDGKPEETVVAKTLVRKKGEKAKLMERYIRSLNVAMNSEGRIDWARTDAELTPIEDENFATSLGEYFDGTSPLKFRSDPEFFAAGTAEKVISLGR